MLTNITIFLFKEKKTMKWNHLNADKYGRHGEYYYVDCGRLRCQIDIADSYIPNYNKCYLSIYFDDTYSDKIPINNKFDYGRMEFKNLEEAKKMAEEVLIDFANQIIKTVKE